MKKQKTKTGVFHLITLLCANASIVISLMHLVFHVINMFNSSVAFLKSNVTITLMLILSIISAFTAAAVMIILHYRNQKSYFFRKIAYTTFWVCLFSLLAQINVIFPKMIVNDYRNAVWFFVSILSITNSVFCNGLLVTDTEAKKD